MALVTVVLFGVALTSLKLLNIAAENFQDDMQKLVDKELGQEDDIAQSFDDVNEMKQETKK